MSSFFNSTTLQNAYSSIQTIIQNSNLDDAAKQRLAAVSQRIARFESALIEDSVTQHNDSTRYPYDREGLKREFLDEVFGEIVRAILPPEYSTMPSNYPGIGDLLLDITRFDASSFDRKIDFLEAYSAKQSVAVGNLDEAGWHALIDGAYTATVNIAKDFDNWSPLISPSMHIYGEANATPLPHNTYAKKLDFLKRVNELPIYALHLGTQRHTNYIVLQKTAELTELRVVVGNERWNGNAIASYENLFREYHDLIEETFKKGEELKKGPMEGNNRIGINSVVAISPVTYEVIKLVKDPDNPNDPGTPVMVSQTFTHVTSISYNIQDPPPNGPIKKVERSFLLPEGFDIANFKPNATTGGYDIFFPNGQSSTVLPHVLEIESVDVKALNKGLVPKTQAVDGVQVMLLEELPFLPSTAAQAAVTTEYFMNPMDYLYFWNESRVNYFYGQLRYREAIVSEIQEDLRQANLVLAELEKIAGSTRAQGTDGEPNPEAKSETMDMDIWEAINNPATGDVIFDSNGWDDNHNHAEWQRNRTNLKNYIDTKSSEAQQAMLDYQTMLNRYNNAFEVMAKLQEKLQNLVSSQLRNFN